MDIVIYVSEPCTIVCVPIFYTVENWDDFVFATRSIIALPIVTMAMYALDIAKARANIICQTVILFIFYTYTLETCKILMMV